MKFATQMEAAFFHLNVYCGVTLYRLVLDTYTPYFDSQLMLLGDQRVETSHIRIYA
jgi:hypothetical protein